MYGLRKELLEIKDSRQIEKQKRLYRLEGKKQTGPPKRLPSHVAALKKDKILAAKGVIAEKRRRKDSAIRQLIDRRWLVFLDSLLHSRPYTVPIRPRYTLLLFEMFKHQRVASLAPYDSIRPSQEPDQVFRVLVIFAGETS